MMEEIKIWIEKAKRDLEAAKNSLNSKDYEWSSFQAQQAVEKALKALYIKKYKKLIRIHDLVLLAKKIDSPNEIIVLCSKINPSYVDTRYPDVSKDYTKDDAKKILKLSIEVIEWTEKNL